MRTRLPAALLLVTAVVAGCTDDAPTPGPDGSTSEQESAAPSDDATTPESTSDESPSEDTPSDDTPSEDDRETSSLGVVDEVDRSEVEVRIAEILEDLDATDEDLGTTVAIPDTVLFAFDSAELNPGAGDVLDQVVEVALLLEDDRIIVRGHTDDQGDEEYNRDLSQRRAQAVVAYLVDAGVDESLLRAEGLGESEPIATGTSDDARARNRRVEIVLPEVELDDLPDPDQ